MKDNVYALLTTLVERGEMSESQLRNSRSWKELGGFPTLWRLTIANLITRRNVKGTLLYNVTPSGFNVVAVSPRGQ